MSLRGQLSLTLVRLLEQIYLYFVCSVRDGLLYLNFIYNVFFAVTQGF